MPDPVGGVPSDPRSSAPVPAAGQSPAWRRPGAPLRIAWGIAIAADVIQWVFPYVFALGPFTPVDAALDVIVMLALTRLLGWHWAFVPTFAVELLPFIDLAPTWTAAVWIASRRRPPGPPASA